jgi:anti-sigma factor RsiW
MIPMISPCRHCRHHLDAYIAGELPPKTRARLARHLDQCEKCYQAYRKQTALRAELQSIMPSVGKAHQPDFDALWSAIKTEIVIVERPIAAQTPMRLSVALAMLVLLVFLPLLMSGRDVTAAALPLQPVPELDVSLTPTGDDPLVVAATMTASQTKESVFIPLASAPPTVPEPVVSNE